MNYVINEYTDLTTTVEKYIGQVTLHVPKLYNRKLNNQHSQCYVHTHNSISIFRPKLEPVLKTFREEQLLGRRLKAVQDHRVVHSEI